LKHTKKTLITTETSEMLIFRRTPPPQRVWCQKCGPDTEMISPDAVSLVTGTSARTIYRMIEAGRVHFTETPDGALLVCISALALIEAHEERENV
jgi:hypothetical protein